MNDKVIVKKLWSLNPNKWKNMTLKDASKQYNEWLEYCLTPKEGHYNKTPEDCKLSNAKSFIEWLETEI